MKVCEGCRGQGIVEKLVQLGPGMFTKAQQHCGECGGQGQTVSEKDRCEKCRGRRVVHEEKKLEVPVEPGVPGNHDIVFTGESDEEPGVMAADLYVRVQIKEHPVFKRKGADLFAKRTISLQEALLGVSLEVEHLDGKVLKVASFPGECLKHEEIKLVRDEGMPFFKDISRRGNLYMELDIEFPKKLDPSLFDKLRQVLPKSNAPKLTEGIAEDDQHFLEEYDEHDTNPNPEGGKADYEEEEENMQGATRVQCAIQ